MKTRTTKKRIRRYLKWFAKHKISKSFSTGKERREWVKEVSKKHFELLNVR